jgi:hypothetical protein
VGHRCADICGPLCTSEAISARLWPPVRFCGPLPYRRQKEARCLPVCVVKRLQLLQRVFGCRVPRPLPSGLSVRHSEVCLRRRCYACCYTPRSECSEPESLPDALSSAAVAGAGRRMSVEGRAATEERERGERERRGSDLAEGVCAGLCRGQSTHPNNRSLRHSRCRCKIGISSHRGGQYPPLPLRLGQAPSETGRTCSST